MTEPYSLSELAAAFRRLDADAASFWSAFAADDFVRPLGTAWSPAENVRHLIKSTRPVAMALRLPRPELVGRFGRPTRPSRTYAELRRDYQTRLIGGVDAGPYAPEPAEVSMDVAARQSQELEALANALSELERAMAQWDDAELDQFQLPHPLLGNLTLREMLFFTHYHHLHHIENVTRLRGSEKAAT